MIQRAQIVVVLACALAACGGEKDAGGGKAAKAEKNSDVAALFTGSAPALPPELADVKLRSSKQDALKAARAESDSGFVASKTHDGVHYDLRFKDELLEQITITTSTELAPILTKQWGEPIKTKKEQFWFAPASGTRAYLPDYGKGKLVTFDAYEPVERLIGATGFELAFAAGKPLLGATLDELKAAWGNQLCDFDEQAPKLREAYAEAERDALYPLRDVRRELRLCSALPRTVDLGKPFGDQIRLGLDGNVASIYLGFDTNGSEALQQQLVALMDAKFGKATVVPTEHGINRYYFDPASKRRAKVHVGERTVSVELSSYLPVAELIGGDKPGLSIENPHLPVGTFAAIKAADPEHYRQRGVLASLYYPPTEFAQQHTEVQLDFFDKHTKTHGYSVVLHHTDNEAAGDQVFELLKAKFREPKLDKRSTDEDKTYLFAKNGRKVSARRVKQQWQLRVTN